ncbi:MAG: peptidoglycan-associated lipoprotein Pal [Deltaproteobacteria bacterium]|nr:peptidoglycan-associated lipoprotein Pal [Deltaproteobacteria bacterium]
MVFAVGCAKKQTVKSTETAAPAAAAPPGAPSGPAEGAAPEGIVTEKMKPEAPKAEETKVAAAEAGAAVTEEKPSVFADIHFEFDKSNILGSDKPTLSKIAEYMKKNGGAKLLIEGHCDERGTAEYNMALGDRRAESARKYLVSLGVPAGALSMVSFGKEKPLDPGHNEEAWAKNRRAHFVLK